METDRLKPGKLMPDFALPNATGERVRLSDYRNRANLAVIFSGGMDTQEVEALISGLMDYRARFGEESGEALVVLPMTQEAVWRMQRGLNPPFPLLVDPDGAVHRRLFATRGDNAPFFTVYVLDRYGEIFGILQEPVESASPQVMEEIYEWLRFIELQCPE
jgi:peroxiredoxin